MEGFRKAQVPAISPLYNVVENYTQALSTSRSERGEPTDGILRRAWETKQWVGKNSLGVIGGFVIFFAAISGVQFLRSRKPRANSKERIAGDLRQEQKAA